MQINNASQNGHTSFARPGDVQMCCRCEVLPRVLYLAMKLVVVLLCGTTREETLHLETFLLQFSVISYLGFVAEELLYTTQIAALFPET